MKKFLERNFGIILFYGMVIIGVLMLNYRFTYLNSNNVAHNSNQIALNK